MLYAKFDMKTTNVAYLKKNYVLIFFRFFKYCIFRILVKLSPVAHGPFESIIFDCSDSFDNVGTYKISEFRQLINVPVKTTNANLASQHMFQFVEKSDLRKSRSLILINEFSFFQCLLYFGSLSRFRIVDRFFWSSYESEIWNRIFLDLMSEVDRSTVYAGFRKNFINYLSLCPNKKKSICFTTGPSFDKYRNYDFVSCFKVICNSIVKNEEFLEDIKGPDVLVFADPVFHFGLNPYAKKFREQVSKVMLKYENCYIFTTTNNAILLRYMLPELSERVIGLDTVKEYGLIDEKNMRVYPTQNILTLLMLPLAATFSNEINVIGADGRNPKENYFWQHSNSVQYSESMENAFNYHVSFFRDRIYSKYYSRHCDQLEIQLRHFEKYGKQFISLTPSFIPALKRRFKESL